MEILDEDTPLASNVHRYLQCRANLKLMSFEQENENQLMIKNTPTMTRTVKHTTKTDMENKIALLIDADNAQAELIENILAEACKHEKVTIDVFMAIGQTTNLVVGKLK